VPFFRPIATGSLTQRLVILFTFILLVPTVLNVFLAWDAFSENTKRAKLAVRQFAVLAATYERRFFDDTRRILQRLANEQAIRNQEADRCTRLLRQILENSREFSNLIYSDADGRPVCWTADSIKKVPVQTRLQGRAVVRDFSLSDYMFTPDSPFPVIIATQPVFADDGHLKGVLSASIELYWLTTFVHEAACHPTRLLPSRQQRQRAGQSGPLLRQPEPRPTQDGSGRRATKHCGLRWARIWSTRWLAVG